MWTYEEKVPGADLSGMASCVSVRSWAVVDTGGPEQYEGKRGDGLVCLLNSD